MTQEIVKTIKSFKSGLMDVADAASFIISGWEFFLDNAKKDYYSLALSIVQTMAVISLLAAFVLFGLGFLSGAERAGECFYYLLIAISGLELFDLLRKETFPVGIKIRSIAFFSWCKSAIRLSIRRLSSQPLTWIVTLFVLALLLVNRNTALHQVDPNKENETSAITTTNTPAIIATTSQVTMPAPSSTPQDSDRDGLSDEAELEKYKSDPQNPDTDGDGFNDGQEVRNGYDPAGPGRLNQ